jgi:trehalose-phosphatase
LTARFPKPICEAASPDALASKLAPGPGRLGLLIDFDGTLAEIVARPADAWPPPGIIRALEALAARDDLNVGIVSGRRLIDLVERVPVPGVWHVGGHGAEVRRPDGAAELPGDLPGARAAIATFVERAAALAGRDVLVEDKGLSAAVHLRGLPPEDAARIAHAAATIADALALTAPVLRSGGKAVVELRVAGIDKGRMALDLLERWGSTRCAALGDDETDEDMFRAVARSASIAKGLTIKVGPGESDAGWRLRGVGEVEAFLAALVRARRTSPRDCSVADGVPP